jgi:hypothetical protein
MSIIFVLLMILSINTKMDEISIREEINFQESSELSDSSSYFDCTNFSIIINRHMSNRSGFVIMSDSVYNLIANNPEIYKDGSLTKYEDYHIIISNQDYKKLLSLFLNNEFSKIKYEEAKWVLHIIINKYPNKYLIKDIELNKDLQKVIDIFNQVIKDEKERKIIIDIIRSKKNW